MLHIYPDISSHTILIDSNFHGIICSELQVASPWDHTFMQQEFSLWAVISSELTKEIFMNMLNFQKSCKQLLTSQLTLFHGIGYLVMTLHVSVYCFISLLVLSQ